MPFVGVRLGVPGSLLGGAGTSGGANAGLRMDSTIITLDMTDLRIDRTSITIDTSRITIDMTNITMDYSR